MKHFLGKFAPPIIRPPLWVLLFVASAVLFLGGSVSFWVAGSSYGALAGLTGALASMLMIWLFAGEHRPPRR